MTILFALNVVLAFLFLSAGWVGVLLYFAAGLAGCLLFVKSTWSAFIKKAEEEGVEPTKALFSIVIMLEVLFWPYSVAANYASIDAK